MFKREIELSIVDQINIYNGSRMISNKQGVDSLAAYRFGKNAEILESRVVEFEQQRLIVLRDFTVIEKDGSIAREQDGTLKFKSDVSRVDADASVKKLIDTLGKEKYNLWFFEASEIDKSGGANIVGDLWRLIDLVVVDNGPTT